MKKQNVELHEGSLPSFLISIHHPRTSNAFDFCPWCRLALLTVQFVFTWVECMARTCWCLAPSTHHVSESSDQVFGSSLTQGLVSGCQWEPSGETVCIALGGTLSWFLRRNPQIVPKCFAGQ